MCFSRVRPDHPRCRSATWICMCGHTRGLVIHSKFHLNPFRGYGTPGGRNLAFPITLASRFYNSLYYRTSRDAGVKLLFKMYKYANSSMTPLRCTLNNYYHTILVIYTVGHKTMPFIFSL